mmetsp:Transcript_8445/g.25488  ORF Transcript_8445/g.25488 Transcript_8445/m.25488 type:complete len:204 (+) Transcript_8445:59-670(+)
MPTANKHRPSSSGTRNSQQRKSHQVSLSVPTGQPRLRSPSGVARLVSAKAWAYGRINAAPEARCIPFALFFRIGPPLMGPFPTRSIGAVGCCLRACWRRMAGGPSGPALTSAPGRTALFRPLGVVARGSLAAAPGTKVAASGLSCEPLLGAGFLRPPLALRSLIRSSREMAIASSLTTMRATDSASLARRLPREAGGFFGSST